MSNVQISGGMFWFWGGAWWEHLEALPPELISTVRGVQVLCEPVRGSMELPPVDIGQRMARRWNLMVHPTFDRGPLVWDAAMENALRSIENWLQLTGVRDVLVHVDHVPRGELDLARLRSCMPSATLLIENLGAGHKIGTQPEHIHAMLADCPGLGFGLDVAHWHEVAGGNGDLSPWLNDKLIVSRLAAVHVSTSGLADPKSRALVSGELTTASHLPAFLNPDYPEPRWKERLGAYPLISEGCLPAGELGRQWLGEELQYLSNWRTPCHA